MSTGAIIMLSVIGLIVLWIIITVIMIYNGLVTVKNNVKKGWSNIDVLLKQRFDELPKLVKVCERYMKHEAETLEKVTQARNMVSGAKGMNELGKAEGMLEGALKTLFAVSENYPELKADANFRQLQGRITEMENEIADRREIYNEYINIYNITIEKFPDVIIANMLNYKEKEMWQIAEAERKDPGVNFSS